MPYISCYFFFLAPQPALGVVFYSPLADFSFLAYEVSPYNDAPQSVGLL